MSDANEIRAGRHCVSNLHVHLVFITKYRRRVFTRAVLSRLQEIVEAVCADFEAQLGEFDGEEDHVHLLIHYPPKVAISKLVNSPERSFLTPFEARVSRFGKSLLARRAVVAKLLRRLLRRCAHFHHQAMYSTATNS